MARHLAVVAASLPSGAGRNGRLASSRHFARGRPACGRRRRKPIPRQGVGPSGRERQLADVDRRSPRTCRRHSNVCFSTRRSRPASAFRSARRRRRHRPGERGAVGTCFMWWLRRQERALTSTSSGANSRDRSHVHKRFLRLRLSSRARADGVGFRDISIEVDGERLITGSGIPPMRHRERRPSPLHHGGGREAPIGAGRYGLIVMSHGTGGGRLNHRDTAIRLARPPSRPPNMPGTAIATRDTAAHRRIGGGARAS